MSDNVGAPSSEIFSRLAQGLEGRYSLKSEIGSGGMALVFSARDERHDRNVAIKVLRPEIGAAIGSERFLREIRVCGKLFHPHILSIFDSGETDGLLYYVMPLLGGQSLRDKIVQSGTIPISSAIQITTECCDALAFAHANGVIHRDIKPENILFEADHAIIADFGIARAVGASDTDRLTTLGIAVGTPAYMSPEQAAGEPSVDERSDIYSLATVLFEMLSGRTPFGGASGEVMAKQVTERPPKLKSIRPDIPDKVSEAIDRALAKNPADRFESAREFSSELRAAQTYAPQKSKWVAYAVAGLTLAAALITYRLIETRRTNAAALTMGAVASGLNRQLSQLTFAEGVEQWPAWSPDGKSLAYAADDNGHRGIFVRILATGEDRRLTSGTFDEIQPTWAAQGERIAFVRSRNRATRLEPADVNGTYQEGGDVWTIDIRSGKETKIIDNAFDPAFSPDGKQIAFDATWGGAQRLWIADQEGRNSRQVTSDSSEAVVHAEPSWSHDSGQLVFRRAEKTVSDIAVLNIATQKITALTQDNILDLNPVFAKDDRAIYYASAGGGGGINIWMVPVAPSGARAGASQQLTTGAGDDINPSVGPEGQVAFSLRAFNSDIWRLPVNPQTGLPRGKPEAVSATTRVESRGAWSPDGRMIAFNSDRRGEMNLWVKSLATGAERQLTKGAGGDYQANWAPDAKTLIFFSSRAGNSDVWAADVATGKLTQLTTDGAMDTNPFYSPDGKSIAFMSDRRGRLEVWAMLRDGSNQHAISDVRVGGHFIRWSADGQTVIFRGESGNNFQTTKVRVADGRAEQLRDVASGAHMSWSPNYTIIMDVKGHKNLTVYPLSGRPDDVFGFPESQVRIDYPVWSPDGKWVLFDRAAPLGGDIWVLRPAN